MFGCRNACFLRLTLDRRPGAQYALRRDDRAGREAKDSTGFKGERPAGGPTLRILSAAEELFGSVLNPFAGLLHVLAEAVGRVAADADNGQERGDNE